MKSENVQHGGLSLAPSGDTARPISEFESIEPRETVTHSESAVVNYAVMTVIEP